MEDLLRAQWASALRSAATEVKNGGSLGNAARRLSGLSDTMKTAAKALD